MQIFVGSLPLSSDGILQCVKFINQMSGYTQTLERKIAQGGALDEGDLATLSEMHNTLNEMKEFLNDVLAWVSTFDLFVLYITVKEQAYTLFLDGFFIFVV